MSEDNNWLYHGWFLRRVVNFPFLYVKNAEFELLD